MRNKDKTERVKKAEPDRNYLINKISGDIADIQNFINVCSMSGNYYDRRKTGKSDKEIAEWIKVSTPKVLIVALKINIAEFLMMQYDNDNSKRIESGKLKSMFETYKEMTRSINSQMMNKN